MPWLAQKLKAKKIGVLAYQVPQSADCAKGLQAAFDKYPSAKIEFLDTSLAFGVTDLSNDVSADEGQGRRLRHDLHGQQRNADAGQGDEEAGPERHAVPAERVQPEVHRGERSVLPGLVRVDVLHAVRGEAEAEGPQGLPEVDEEGRLRAERELDGGLDQRRPVRDRAARRRAPTSPARRSSTRSTRRRTSPPTGSSPASTGASRTRANQPEGCNVLSKIEDGKFVPSFGQPGKPFVCSPAEPVARQAAVAAHRQGADGGLGRRRARTGDRPRERSRSTTSSSGIPFGCVFALVAVGLVLTYKTSGVFNLAFGAQAFVSAAVFYDTVTNHDWPLLPAFILSVFIVAPLLGLILERALFRHLRTAPAIAKLVTSLGLLVAIPEIVKLLPGLRLPPELGVQPADHLAEPLRLLPLRRLRPRRQPGRDDHLDGRRRAVPHRACSATRRSGSRCEPWSRARA